MAEHDPIEPRDKAQLLALLDDPEVMARVEAIIVRFIAEGMSQPPADGPETEESDG